jgi:2-hydroxychromene-2-carboxylate isomerase
MTRRTWPERATPEEAAMTLRLEFFFDFLSPYPYLASTRLGFVRRRLAAPEGEAA